MFHPFVGQPVEPLPVAILGIWKGLMWSSTSWTQQVIAIIIPFIRRILKLRNGCRICIDIYIYIMCVCALGLPKCLLSPKWSYWEEAEEDQTSDLGDVPLYIYINIYIIYIFNIYIYTYIHTFLSAQYSALEVVEQSGEKNPPLRPV